MDFLFLCPADCEEQHEVFEMEASKASKVVEGLWEAVSADKAGLLVGGVAERIAALERTTELVSVGTRSRQESQIASARSSFRDSSDADPRRSSVRSQRRTSSSASLRRPTRKSGKPQELTAAARRMAKERTGSSAATGAEEEQDGERVGERGDGEPMTEHFAPDEEGELSKYLDGMFKDGGRQERVSSAPDYFFEEGAKDSRLPTLESTLKVIGLEFVLGDSLKGPLPAKLPPKKRVLEPLAERVVVGNPIKVESLFSSYTLYTVTLEKRGVRDARTPPPPHTHTHTQQHQSSKLSFFLLGS